MSVTELALKRDQIQVGTISERQAEERWGWGRAVGGMKSFNKHRSACVSLCLCVQHMCHEFCAQKERKKERKKKRIFVRSTRLRGEVMATGRRESTRLFCCSLLLVVSVVQLLATGQWSETLCQGALTRFDSRIELQSKQQEK